METCLFDLPSAQFKLSFLTQIQQPNNIGYGESPRKILVARLCRRPVVEPRVFSKPYGISDLGAKSSVDNDDKGLA
jgi:hypothetical protein